MLWEWLIWSVQFLYFKTTAKLNNHFFYLNSSEQNWKQRRKSKPLLFIIIYDISVVNHCHTRPLSKNAHWPNFFLSLPTPSPSNFISSSTLYSLFSPNLNSLPAGLLLASRFVKPKHSTQVSEIIITVYSWNLKNYQINHWNKFEN